MQLSGREIQSHLDRSRRDSRHRRQRAQQSRLAESQFAEIRKNTNEPERLKQIDRILNWEDPGPGGFYDDLGNLARQPHLVRGLPYDKDPAFLQSSDGRPFLSRRAPQLLVEHRGNTRRHAAQNALRSISIATRNTRSASPTPAIAPTSKCACSLKVRPTTQLRFIR